MYLKKLLALIIFLSTFPVFADTYPASSQYCMTSNYDSHQMCASTAQSLCTGLFTADLVLSAGVGYYGVYGSATQCYGKTPTGGGAGSYNYYNVLTCPSGGTLSASNCINAPACISPQVRKLLTPYSCFTPIECNYPEVDNGNGQCQNLTCPSGQSRHPITNLCQVKPVCGSTETYDIYTNICKLYPLNCPGNTHPSAANDACLPNAPLACPMGQHDNGTYLCVADDATACKSTQQGGYINGQWVCVNKTSPEQATATSEAAKIAATLALATLTNAQTALAANPTSAPLQTAVTVAQADYNQKKAISDDFQKARDSDTLTSIDQTLKGDVPVPISGTDTLTQMESQSGTNLNQSGTGFFSSLIGLPTYTGCQTVQMHYKSLNYTFDPCGRLATFREMFGYLLYVMTAFGIYQIAIKPGA